MRTAGDGGEAAGPGPRVAPRRADVERVLGAPARLRALAELEALDRPADPAFDRLTTLAGAVLRAPIALVTLVEDRRQFFTSAHGLPEPWHSRRETPLSHSFCQHVVLSGAPVVIRNARQHPLVCDNLAIPEMGVAAYLGHPIVLAEGVVLGSFAVADTRPRDWTETDSRLVREFAALATREFVLGRAARTAAALLAHASDAFLALDREGRIASLNEAAERLAGGTRRALVGRPAWEALPRALADALGPHLRRAVDDRRVAEVELRLGADADVDAPDADRALEVRVLPFSDGVAVVARDITARRRAEAALRASEARYALAAAATGQAVWEWEPRRGARRWAAGGRAAFGYPESDRADDAPWWEPALHPEDRERVLDGLRAAAAGGGDAWRDEYRLRRADGSYAQVVDRAAVTRDAAGRAARMIGALEDVTERRRVEAQLRQAQKLEALGQLAAGIAHDFNNLLTVVSANLEFALEDLPPGAPGGQPARDDVEEAARAIERARALVRQLLLFGRGQPTRPQLVSLRRVVAGVEQLLRRAIGEQIALVVLLDDDGVVRADPGQLEQLLMNLAVNARDAMLTPRHGTAGRGGTLEIRVDVATEAAAPGRWVRLAVRDSGHGMDADTQAHAFEPFFTTKPPGSGTGLGLATVFGIVRQAAGTIRVDSAPGRGTTFTVLLPAADEDASAPARGAEGAAGGGDPTPPPGTVLLVEDETAVRLAARRMLERGGHTVLDARHGGDALLVWRAHRARIDALVTDLRMPELGGRELATRLQEDRPGLPVVFLSGYSERGAVARGPLEAFVDKPFTAESLLSALAAVRRRAAR